MSEKKRIVKRTNSAVKTQTSKSFWQNNLSKFGIFLGHILVYIGLYLRVFSRISSLDIIITHIPLLCPRLHTSFATRPTLVHSVLLTIKFWKPPNSPPLLLQLPCVSHSCIRVHLNPTNTCFSRHFSVLSPH